MKLSGFLALASIVFGLAPYVARAGELNGNWSITFTKGGEEIVCQGDPVTFVDIFYGGYPVPVFVFAISQRANRLSAVHISGYYGDLEGSVFRGRVLANNRAIVSLSYVTVSPSFVEQNHIVRMKFSRIKTTRARVRRESFSQRSGGDTGDDFRYCGGVEIGIARF